MNFNLMTTPLDQFEISDLMGMSAPMLGDMHVSLTNMSFYLMVSFFMLLNFNLISNNFNSLVPNNWSISQECIYATMHNMVVNQINDSKGQLYFPFIFSLFMFMLVNNLIGMMPYSFASTSHFILTFAMSFTVVLGATMLGFQEHGIKFFALFVPAGCPLGMLPLLVMIEFMSYLTSNMSLGLSLAANMFSGHMLLNILSGFTYNMMNSGFFYFFLAFLPLAFMMAFSGLELAMAFIQAQVFVVLTCSYMKDSLDLH